LQIIANEFESQSLLKSSFSNKTLDLIDYSYFPNNVLFKDMDSEKYSTRAKRLKTSGIVFTSLSGVFFITSAGLFIRSNNVSNSNSSLLPGFGEALFGAQSMIAGVGSLIIGLPQLIIGIVRIKRLNGKPTIQKVY
jgi:hypothetical protein